MRKLIKENKEPWPMSDNATPNEYYINQLLDRLDTVACEVESRWGVMRLELLVSHEMNLKWGRQCTRLREALLKKDAGEVAELVEGSIKGYAAMEREAVALGNKPHDAPLAWTVGLPSGSTLAIVRHPKDASLMNDLKRDHGDVVVWTIDEIANIIENEYTLVNVKTETTKTMTPSPFNFTKGDDIPDLTSGGRITPAQIENQDVRNLLAGAVKKI